MRYDNQSQLGMLEVLSGNEKWLIALDLLNAGTVEKEDQNFSDPC
jgi:hypothetical protein